MQRGPTAFDHAVIMVRDRLEALAPHYERQGFRLSDKAVHNLGSCNQLIVLDDTYIELLGWPPGAPPARKEIADSPLGLEALVFRSDDAEATYERLRQAGFAVNPVQELTRMARVGGREMPARFHTVRFCRAAHPWFPHVFLPAPDARVRLGAGVHGPSQWRAPPGAYRRSRADAQALARRMAQVADADVQAQADGWDVVLANLRIHVVQDAAAATPALTTLTLADRDGSQYVLNTGI